MLDEFDEEHEGKVKIDATTCEWGVPFYGEVQTSAAVGQGPDIMTYHKSRMPLRGLSTGSLTRSRRTSLPPPASRRAISDRPTGRPRRNEQQAIWRAARYPLDHSLLQQGPPEESGLLGDDGEPRGLDGVANWDAALAKLTTKEVAALSVPGDNASGWRIFYTLPNQQGGEFLKGDKLLDGDNLAKATTAIAEYQKWVKSS